MRHFVTKKSSSIVQRGRLLLASTCFALCLIASLDAVAKPPVIDISKYGTFSPSTCPGAELCGEASTNGDEFYAFAQDITSLMLPPIGTSAKTLGEAGTSIQYINSFVTLSGNHDAFKIAFPNQEPPSTFIVGNLMLRKGLPYSFELGANASYAYGKGLYALGFDIKYAFIEDFKWTPDIAAMIGIGSVIGINNFSQASLTISLLLSKPFGIAGSFILTPRFAAQIFSGFAGSNVLSANPADPREPIDNPNRQLAYLPAFEFPFRPTVLFSSGVNGGDQENFVYERLSAGVEFQVALLTIASDLVYQPNDKTIQGSLAVGLTF